MTNLKKVNISSVSDDDVISMSFDENPNIPTANYSDKTLSKINEVVAKKMRAEKIKKMIEAELKDDVKNGDEFLNMSFNFGSM